MKVWAYVALAGIAAGTATGVSTCSHTAGVNSERARWLENEKAITEARDKERARLDQEHAAQIKAKLI